MMRYAGHDLEVAGLVANGRLPYLMDTPSTKDKVDRTIEAADLIAEGVCSEGQYQAIRNASLMAFGMVTQYLASRGMVLVDTKTEHGINSAGRIAARWSLNGMAPKSGRRWVSGGSLGFRSASVRLISPSPGRKTRTPPSVSDRA